MSYWFEHYDPSLSNLMVVNQGRGVLNDRDRRIRHDIHQGNQNRERTGTVPSMSLDLLTGVHWAGSIPRLYGHDLEAFVWILFWEFLRYEGQEPVKPMLDGRNTGVH